MHVETCESLRPKPLGTYMSHACRDYSPAIHEYLQQNTGDRFTLIIRLDNKISELKMTRRLLRNYATTRSIDRILVMLPTIGHSKGLNSYPLDMKIGKTLVYFLHGGNNPHGNNIAPSMLIRTNYVLVLIDDVMMRESNITHLFHAWRREQAARAIRKQHERALYSGAPALFQGVAISNVKDIYKKNCRHLNNRVVNHSIAAHSCR